MKILAAFFVSMFFAFSLADAKTASHPHRAAPATLRARIVRIQALSHDLQTKLDAANQQLGDANAHADDLQNQIDAQSAALSKAQDDAAVWRQKQEEALKKLWWWRLHFGIAAVVSVILLALLIAVKFFKWGIPVAAEIAKPAII